MAAVEAWSLSTGRDVVFHISSWTEITLPSGGNVCLVSQTVEAPPGIDQNPWISFLPSTKKEYNHHLRINLLPRTPTAGEVYMGLPYNGQWKDSLIDLLKPNPLSTYELNLEAAIDIFIISPIAFFFLLLPVVAANASVRPGWCNVTVFS